MRKFILIDSGVEWGLISVGALLLSRIGRPDLMPQLCGVIVGLHFLPIAKVFRLPFYYWVGGIMIVGEASSILIIRGDLRNIVGCASVGLTLWVASAVILFRISAAFRAPSDR